MSKDTPLLKHHRACHLCEALCGLVIEHDGMRIHSIRGDKDDPLSRGHLCPKAWALHDIHVDPDRLKKPMRRIGTQWEEISWEEAFEEVVTRMQSIQKKYGRDAVGVYLGNPNVHNYGTILMGQLFLRVLRTKNRFSATSLDQLPHMLTAYAMFGHQLMMPVPDVEHTDFLVIMGGNPLVSNGSIMTAPGFKKRMKAIQARGGQIVVIDPRRTETAKCADRHIFIRPGSDVMLLLAVLCVLLEENRVHLGHLEQYIDGYDALSAHMHRISPHDAEQHTGVPAETILWLARSFATAQRAAWYGRLGVSAQSFGAVTHWLLHVLHVVTGHLDTEGGMMFAHPAFDLIERRLSGRGHFGRWHSRVRGVPEFGSELPTSVLAEEIDTPGTGQIRALFTSAGNPVLSSPNSQRLEQALQSLDYMVSFDIYINETTRHAHLILPPSFGVEHDNYDVVFHHLAVRNTTRYSPALFEPAEDALHDWEIFLELYTRWMKNASFTQRIKTKWMRRMIRWLGPHRVVDWGLRVGAYGSSWRLWKDGLSLRKLKHRPHGVDLGPLRSCLPERLQTSDGRLHLAPEFFLRDLQRVYTFFEQGAPPSSSGPAPVMQSEGSSKRIEHNELNTSFRLIGRRHLRSNNSWMHNSLRLVRGRPRCTLLIHPEDAMLHGWKDGQRVRCTSRTGTLTVELSLSDEMMRGVVSLPHGWGHTDPHTRLSVAERYPGVNLNTLTDEQEIDALSGNAVLNGVQVQIVAECVDVKL